MNKRLFSFFHRIILSHLCNTVFSLSFHWKISPLCWFLKCAQAYLCVLFSSFIPLPSFQNHKESKKKSKVSQNDIVDIDFLKALFSPEIQVWIPNSLGFFPLYISLSFFFPYAFLHSLWPHVFFFSLNLFSFLSFLPFLEWSKADYNWNSNMVCIVLGKLLSIKHKGLGNTWQCMSTINQKDFILEEKIIFLWLSWHKTLRYEHVKGL